MPPRAAAKAIFETRGNAPRLYRNTLVFLAADKTRLQDLDEAVRKFLAWESILDEKDTLDLSPTPGEAGRDAEDGRRRRRDGQASRNVPVVAGADAGEPASPCNVADDSSLRPGRARGARQQEAQETMNCL